MLPWWHFPVYLLGALLGAGAALLVMYLLLLAGVL